MDQRSQSLQPDQPGDFTNLGHRL